MYVLRWFLKYFCVYTILTLLAVTVLKLVPKFNSYQFQIFNHMILKDCLLFGQLEPNVYG